MKAKRHEKIIELVNKYNIETQTELTNLLEDAGFEVTQATISRDIRELKLSKVNGPGGKQKYAFMPGGSNRNEARLNRVLREGYISSSKASRLIVVKTLSGMANAVAAALDAMELDGYAGSVAGDDTIFCAVSEGADMDLLYDNIIRIINQKL